MTGAMPDYVKVWMWACPDPKRFGVAHGTLRRHEGWYAKYLFESESRGTYLYRAEVPIPDHFSNHLRWMGEVVVGLLAQDYMVSFRKGEYDPYGAFISTKGHTAVLNSTMNWYAGHAETPSEALVAACMEAMADD